MAERCYEREHTQKELGQLHDRAPDDDSNAETLGQRVLETFDVGEVELFND